jgi:hypothetical protein
MGRLFSLQFSFARRAGSTGNALLVSCWKGCARRR